MKLRFVYRGDFRKSEVTLYEEAVSERPQMRLRNGDCVALVSSTGKQIKFVYGYTELGETSILSSETHRITGGGAWNPLMLSDYAAAVGLELEGLPNFERHYRRMRDEKKRRR